MVFAPFPMLLYVRLYKKNYSYNMGLAYEENNEYLWNVKSCLVFQMCPSRLVHCGQIVVG